MVLTSNLHVVDAAAPAHDFSTRPIGHAVLQVTAAELPGRRSSEEKKKKKDGECTKNNGDPEPELREEEVERPDVYCADCDDARTVMQNKTACAQSREVAFLETHR